MHAVLAIALLLFLVVPTQARVRGTAPLLVTGNSQIGGFDVNGQSFAFINFLKNGTSLAAGSYAYPSILDNNGYPTVAPTTAITMNVVIPLNSTYSGNYVLKQRGVSTSNVPGSPTGTWGNVRLTTPGTTFTVVSDYNSNVTSNSGTNITVSGANPRVVLTLNGLPNTGNGNTLVLSFLTTGGTYTTPDIVFCRADQEPLLDAGEIFNPDFIALLTALNPKTIRTMDWSSINGSLWSRFDYRAPVSALSYRVSRWQPAAWAGTVGNTGGAYSVSAPSGWGGLVEGETVQGQFTNGNSSGNLTITGAANNGSGLIRLTLADTSSLSTNQRVAFSSSGGTGNGSGVWTITVVDGTHIDLQGSTYQSNITGTVSATTLNVGSTGDKLVSGSGGVATITAGDVGTVIYDSVRDSYVYVPRGMGASDGVGAVPIEIQVALANKLRKNLWTNVPFDYTDASITDHVTYVRDNLSSGLTAYFELSNEVWNPAFTQFGKAYIRGAQLGFPVGNNEQGYGYYGLRVRQMMGAVKSLYDASGKTNYKRVMAFQAFGSSVNTKAYMLDGADLVTGNAKYDAFTGSVSYNTFPNRPVDFVDALSYATYYSGATITAGEYAASGTYTGMTGAADDYASGVPAQMAAALSWVDNDLRSGTSTIPGFTYQTIGALDSNIYPKWENIADDYDGARPPGVANLTVDLYEGGLESIAPTTAQCTTIGISTTYATTVATLLTAYKNSDLFYQLVIDQYSQFQSQPHSRVPSWFALQGTTGSGGKWSMLPGSTYSGPTSLGSGFLGTPYQSWDGTVSFNN